MSFRSSVRHSPTQLLCPCGGVWAAGQPRTLTHCDVCDLEVLAGAHGLGIGKAAPSFGSVAMGSGQLVAAEFGPSRASFATALDVRTDFVYIYQGANSGESTRLGPC
jgi:hypothetical protein